MAGYRNLDSGGSARHRGYIAAGKEGPMAQVKAVPEGYRTVTPFLNVKGAAEALEFYKKAFGAEERVKVPGPNGTIMHSELRFGDSLVMVSDAMMNPPTQASIHLYVPDADASWKRATDAGATIVMPI